MVHLRRSTPTIQNAFAALIAATWKDCLDAMTSFAETESPHLLLLAWTQAVLTTTGMPPSQRAVENGHRILLTALHEYEERAEQWMQAREAGQEALHLLLTESETGFVGMALYTLALRRERPPLYQHVQRMFLESLQHNLSKPTSDLHLARSGSLLFGVSAGLTTLPNHLSASLAQQLMDALWGLYDSARPLDAYKILMSISLLQARKVILDEQRRLNTRARLESPSVLSVDKICLLLSLLDFSQLTSEGGLRIQIALLDQVKLLSLPSLTEQQRLWLCSFLLPWLNDRICSKSLFKAWSGYASDQLKRSTIVNYFFFYSSSIVLGTYVLRRVFWATLIQASPNVLPSVLIAYITVWLQILLVPLDRIWQMYGKKFPTRITAVVMAILGLIAILASAKLPFSWLSYPV